MKEIGKLKTKILIECTSWSVKYMNEMLWKLIDMVKVYQHTEDMKMVKEALGEEEKINLIDILLGDKIARNGLRQEVVTKIEKI